MNETVLSRNGKFLLNLHRVVSLQCLLPGRDQDSGSEPGLQGVGLEVMGFPVEPALRLILEGGSQGWAASGRTPHNKQSTPLPQSQGGYSPTQDSPQPCSACMESKVTEQGIGDHFLSRMGFLS